MKTTRSKLWKPADQKCENQPIKMKTSRSKADAEAGDRKEGSVLNFNDSSIRLSFIRKVTTHFYLLKYLTSPSLTYKHPSNCELMFQVYGLVFTQLAIILAFVLAFSLEDFNQRVDKFKWISCAGSFLVGIIIFLVLACSTAVRRTHPINLLLLAILSICEGWFIGEPVPSSRVEFVKFFPKHAPRFLDIRWPYCNYDIQTCTLLCITRQPDCN